MTDSSASVCNEGNQTHDHPRPQHGLQLEQRMARCGMEPSTRTSGLRESSNELAICPEQSPLPDLLFVPKQVGRGGEWMWRMGRSELITSRRIAAQLPY